MSKGKLKKEKIRQQTEKLNLKRTMLENCEAINDVFVALPSFKHFNKNGFQAELCSYIKMPNNFSEWTFHIMEKNMKSVYEETWGWNEEHKRADLLDPKSRFIYAISDGKPIAFIHYRFELVQDELSAFILSLQVEDQYQRKGLGRFLVQVIEFTALKQKIDSVMVTVFKINKPGHSFFHKMQYVPHHSSPINTDPDNEEDYDQEILYKSLVRS